MQGVSLTVFCGDVPDGRHGRGGSFSFSAILPRGTVCPVSGESTEEGSTLKSAGVPLVQAALGQEVVSREDDKVFPEGDYGLAGVSYAKEISGIPLGKEGGANHCLNSSEAFA